MGKREHCIRSQCRQTSTTLVNGGCGARKLKMEMIRKKRENKCFFFEHFNLDRLANGRNGSFDRFLRVGDSLK